MLALVVLALAGAAPSIAFVNLGEDQAGARVAIERLRQRWHVGAVPESMRAALEDPLDPLAVSQAAELARARSRIDAAHDALTGFDFSAAAERLAQAETILDGLSPSPPLFAAMTDLHLVAGLSFAYQQKSAPAIDAFRLVQRLDAERRLDRAQHPPAVMKLWTDASAASVRHGPLTIDSQPAGAALFVDGRAVGAAPVTLADVGAGPHVISAELSGRAPRSVTVVVADDKRVVVELLALGRELESRLLRASLVRPGVSRDELAAGAATLATIAGVDVVVLVRQGGDGRALVAIAHAAALGDFAPAASTELPSAAARRAPTIAATTERLAERTPSMRRRLLLGFGGGALVAGGALLAAAIWSGARAQQLSDEVSAASGQWTVALDQAVRDGQGAERNLAVLASLSSLLVVAGATLVIVGARRETARLP